MREVILEKLNRQGPTRAWITEEEYAYLRSRFRNLLLRRSPRYWDEEDRLVALGFFRGYTLYREIPEHENQFWRSLFAELEIDEAYPSRDQFDELWKVFSWHTATRPYLVRTSRGRMLVETVNRIFGVRGLRANHLEALLRRYLEARRREEDPEVATWLEKEPSLAQLAHHAEGYARIFEGVHLALRAVEQSPGLAEVYAEQGIDALIAALAANGVYFVKPHPLLYLHHKSERLLCELLEPNRKAPLNPKQSGAAVETRFIAVEGLEGLEGVRIIPSVTGELFFAGRKAVGEVQLASGLKKRFFWTPQIDDDGKPLWTAPEEGAVELGFGEEQVKLRIELRPRSAIGVLASGVEGEVLDWHHRDRLKFRLSSGDPARVRYRLRSGYTRATSFEELWPTAKDTLLIEYEVPRDREYVILHRFPVRYAPRLEDMEIARHGDSLRIFLHAILPSDGKIALRFVSRERVIHKDLPASRDGEYIATLRLKPFEHGHVEITLKPGGPTEKRSVAPTIDWPSVLRRGAGLGAFS